MTIHTYNDHEIACGGYTPLLLLLTLSNFNIVRGLRYETVNIGLG